MGVLERKPGGPDNWLEHVGGLDPYLERIANSIHQRRGKTISNAIQIAWGVIRNWAEGKGDVDPDTRAKAAAAVANMERKRAQYHAQKGINMSEPTFGPVDVAELIDLSQVATDDGSIDLAPGDYRPPYDWKHGYIPLTPAAALSKAKKGPNAGKGRAKAPKGTKVGKTSRPSSAQASRLSKAADDARRGRGVPGELQSAQNSVNASRPRSATRATEAEVRAAKPQGKDARTMTPAEKIKAVDIMHGSDSPAAKRARERWGMADEKPAPAKGTGRFAPKPTSEPNDRQKTFVAAGEASRRGDHVEAARLYQELGNRPDEVARERSAAVKAGQLEPGQAIPPKGSNPDIAKRINAQTQARVAAGDTDASGASSTSKAKGYRDLDGPRLVDEAHKRGLGGKEMLSRKSDSQLRTMLKDHDKNPAASHEDNARARAMGADSNGITVGPADAQVSAPGTWTARRRDDGTVQVLSKNGVELGKVRQITAGKRKGQWEARAEGRKGADYGKTPEQAIDGLYDSYQGKAGAAREQRAKDNNATPVPGDQGSTAIGTRPGKPAPAPSTLDDRTLRNIPDETLDRNIARYQAAHDRAKTTSPATAESPTLRAMKAEKARREAGDTVTDATRKRRRDKDAAEGNARYLEGQRERRDNTPPADLTDTQLATAYAQQQDRTSPRARALKAEQDRRAGKGATKDPFNLPGINVLSDGTVTGDDSRLKNLVDQGYVRPDPTAKPRPYRITDKGRSVFTKPEPGSDRERQAQQLEQARARGVSAGSSKSGQELADDVKAWNSGSPSVGAQQARSDRLVAAGYLKRDRDLNYVVTEKGKAAGLREDAAGFKAPAKLDKATVAKMSDEQLDRAFERLSAAGDSAALNLIGEEMDRREERARRAEGNGRRR